MENNISEKLKILTSEEWDTILSSSPRMLIFHPKPVEKQSFFSIALAYLAGDLFDEDSEESVNKLSKFIDAFDTLEFDTQTDIINRFSSIFFVNKKIDKILWNKISEEAIIHGIKSPSVPFDPEFSLSHIPKKLRTVNVVFAYLNREYTLGYNVTNSGKYVTAELIKQTYERPMDPDFAKLMSNKAKFFNLKDCDIIRTYLKMKYNV